MNKVLLNLSVILIAIVIKFLLTCRLQDNVRNNDIFILLLIGTEAAFYQLVSFLTMGIMLNDLHSFIYVIGFHALIILGIHWYSLSQKQQKYNGGYEGEYKGEEYFHSQGISSWIITDNNDGMITYFSITKCKRGGCLIYDERDELVAKCRELLPGNHTYYLEIINEEKVSSYLSAIGASASGTYLTVAYYDDIQVIELMDQKGILLEIKLSEKRGKETCSIRVRK